MDVIFYMLEKRLSSGIFANLHRGAYPQMVCGCAFATPPGHCMEYTHVIALGSINPPLWFTDTMHLAMVLHSPFILALITPPEDYKPPALLSSLCSLSL